LILPDQQKLNSLARHIHKQLDEGYGLENLTFFLTTYEKARVEGLKDYNIWKAVQGE
jgi:hypothetical protein